MIEHYKGFICEHTAEYFLIPRFIKLVSDKFKNVIPIYPWKTREGSRIALEVHKNYEYNIVGMYARRPKINLDNNDIIVNINSSLVLSYHRALSFGIPIIAGCPIVRNFRMLSENPPYVWINLAMISKDGDELVFNNSYPRNNPGSIFSDKSSILDIIKKKSKKQKYLQFIDSLEKLNSSTPSFRYMFYGIYKPVYFLIF